MMLAQNRTLRRHALGRFDRLLEAMTRATPRCSCSSRSPDSDPEHPNENFARELMELFTLGRGYTERDVREAAKRADGLALALVARRQRARRLRPPRPLPRRHADLRPRGRTTGATCCDVVHAHRRHAPFLVGKLWEFFVTRSRSTRRRSAR